jgi:hypothetical protein
MIGQHDHARAVAEELQVIAPSKLSIENVSKSFRSKAGPVLALDRVSLSVPKANSSVLSGRAAAENRHCSTSLPGWKHRTAAEYSPTANR